MNDEVTLSILDWEQAYDPICFFDGSAYLELQPHHQALLRQLHQKRLLWTELDSGEIVSGLYFVNRLRYLVTRKPYPEGEIIIVLHP